MGEHVAHSEAAETNHDSLHTLFGWRVVKPPRSRQPPRPFGWGGGHYDNWTALATDVRRLDEKPPAPFVFLDVTLGPPPALSLATALYLASKGAKGKGAVRGWDGHTVSLATAL